MVSENCTICNQKLLERGVAEMKRALISVSDKAGIVEFSQKLSDLGIEILSTGGTKKLLDDHNIPCIQVSDFTKFPEMLDGRVKTLHPMIHGGILGIRKNEAHMKEMQEHGIQPIDIAVINLYPFKETISKPNVAWEDAIENIDIGGPAMVRSSAKNHEDVVILVEPVDYDEVIAQLKETGTVSLATKRRLAAKAFRHTAAYDALIAGFLSEAVGEVAPQKLTVTFEKQQDLRYGENPHQRASFYRTPMAVKGSIAYAKKLHGKELSYNNINDANAALQIVKEFDRPAAVAVKHMNPCGVGIGETIFEAFCHAYEADTTSIFGGIVALNREVDRETAEKLHQIFLEIVIAPSFTQEALEILTAKKNIRLLTLDIATNEQKEKAWVTITGGALIQDLDQLGFADADIKVVTKREPTEKEWEDLKLGWAVVKHVKSNAIVLAKDGMTVGIGAGQMNRVGSARIACEQAGARAKGSALASDAFFPMPDTVELAAKSGVTAIIHPGGSVRDEDSIRVADENNIAMVMTGIRHFKH